VTNPAQMYSYLGKYMQSEKTFLKLEEVLKELNVSHSYEHRLGYLLVETGKTKEGWELLDQKLANTLKEIKSGKQAWGLYYDVGIIQAFKGNKEEALKWLKEIPTDIGWGWSDINRNNYMLGDPMLNNLRSDPRFITILEEVMAEEQNVREIFERTKNEMQARNEIRWALER